MIFFVKRLAPTVETGLVRNWPVVHRAIIDVLPTPWLPRMTTFASSCSRASPPSALEVLARFDMGTDAGAGGRRLFDLEGTSILDMLDLTGRGLLVAVVAVDALEGERSRGTRDELVE